MINDKMSGSGPSTPPSSDKPAQLTDAIGFELEAKPYTYTDRDVILYALAGKQGKLMLFGTFFNDIKLAKSVQQVF